MRQVYWILEYLELLSLNNMRLTTSNTLEAGTDDHMAALL